MAQEKVDIDGRTALLSQRRKFVLVIIALLVIVLDQLSKQYVVANLTLGVPWNPIESLRRYVSFTYITNKGAAFGMFPDFSTVFSVVPIIVVMIVLFYYRHLPNQQWALNVGLGLQLGGALGNFIDRMRVGHVVDFIDFKIWPIFNIADSSIVVGVAILALCILRDEEKEPQPKVSGNNQETLD